MSAGTGVRHSEQNGSETEGVHFLQIWIVPDRRDHSPGYEQKNFPAEARRGRLRLLASPDGADGSVSLHQDVRLFGALLADTEGVTHATGARYAWLQIVTGTVDVGGATLGPGDAASFGPGESVDVKATADTELLLFDLA